MRRNAWDCYELTWIKWERTTLRRAQLESVMWIRIDCIRIRIRAGSRSMKSANFQNIFKFLKVKKTLNFQVPLNLLFLRFRLETFNFLRKSIFLLVKLYFFLHFNSDFIPLDPDPRTEMNPDPTGSGSTSLVRIFSLWMLLTHCTVGLYVVV